MKDLCNGCGLCCKLFYINLSKEEYESGEYRTIFDDIGKIENFNKARRYGANLLETNDNNECIYLVGRTCSNYKKRPSVCRDFFCTSKTKKFEGMRKIIKNAKSMAVWNK